MSSAPSPEPTLDVVRRAAEWMAHLESGDAGEDDLAAFRTWRAAHPSHALAVERMGGMGARSAVERETLRRLFRHRPRRRVAGGLLAVLLLTGGGIGLSRLPAVQVQFADAHAPAGRTHTVPLADGSRIVLASKSAADIDMGDGRRTIQLLEGEVLAEVAEGQATRFRVETSHGAAEALGTAFTVRKGGRATLVTVISSHVRVCPAGSGQAGCLTLSAGQRARLDGDGTRRLPDVAPADAAAWTEGWLPADGVPLVRALDELNRWRENPIRFDRENLRDLRVSGIFPLRDTDAALANMARSQPITVDHSDPASPTVRRNRK